MVFVLLILWTIAAVLIVNNPRNESTRWVAFTAFAAGGGGLSRTMTETVIPYLQKHQISNAEIESVLFKLHIVGSFMNHTGTPYCFLMFTICFSGFFRRKAKTVLGIVLPIPIAIMYFLTPMTPDINLNFRYLFYWCVPYLMAGLLLLLISYIKEPIALRKRNRLYTMIFASPPIIFQILVNYTFKAFFDFPEIWRLMPFVIALVFVLFIILLTKEGLLGVKLRFEHDRRESAMRAVTSGALALNHTIKNEIGKIFILSDRIKYVAEKNKQEVIKKDVETILDSTDHMLSMVDRIQKQSQEIVLMPDNHRLCEIIESCLSQMEPVLQSKNIELIRFIQLESLLYCDRVHVSEVLRNVIKNAVDAMGNEGRLRLSAYENRSYIVVEIQDNGSGIKPEDLNRIFHPYFTTKNRSKNFGLGLSYCINVMNKHDGKIDVQSRVNEGTTFSLSFPVKRRAAINQ